LEGNSTVSLFPNSYSTLEHNQTSVCTASRAWVRSRFVKRAIPHDGSCLSLRGCASIWLYNDVLRWLCTTPPFLFRWFYLQWLSNSLFSPQLLPTLYLPLVNDNQSKAMALGELRTTSLEALQNEDQRKVLDIVDKLRRAGLSSVLQRPQLVVCGDQSSGKSSVLEAITEIPFPRKENLCTWFATEIVLRRDFTSSITTKIIPDKNRPASEQENLRSFKKSIADFIDLPGLIDEATVLMGLDRNSQNSTRAFARDVLSIEICGPGRPQL